jgi:hypothetical protein
MGVLTMTPTRWQRLRPALGTAACGMIGIAVVHYLIHGNHDWPDLALIGVVIVISHMGGSAWALKGDAIHV